MCLGCFLVRIGCHAAHWLAAAVGLLLRWCLQIGENQQEMGERTPRTECDRRRTWWTRCYWIRRGQWSLWWWRRQCQRTWRRFGPHLSTWLPSYRPGDRPHIHAETNSKTCGHTARQSQQRINVCWQHVFKTRRAPTVLQGRPKKWATDSWPQFRQILTDLKKIR